MAVYLIAYDLVRSDSQDYEEVHQNIKDLSTDWAHIQLSTFLINSPLGTIEIKNRLKPLFKPKEKLIVATIGDQIAGIHEFGEEVSGWLERNGYNLNL